MRLNLNTKDFSGGSTEELLNELSEYRALQSSAENEDDSEHFEDCADDIWSILYERGELDQDTLVELM